MRRPKPEQHYLFFSRDLASSSTGSGGGSSGGARSELDLQQIAESGFGDKGDGAPLAALLYSMPRPPSAAHLLLLVRVNCSAARPVQQPGAHGFHSGELRAVRLCPASRGILSVLVFVVCIIQVQELASSTDLRSSSIVRNNVELNARLVSQYLLIFDLSRFLGVNC